MVVDDVCCLYLCRFVGFRGVPPRPPKSAGIKPPLLDFACYATSYAQNPTSICSLQLILLSMPKKPTYAVVRASIMGQGLAVFGLYLALRGFQMVHNALGLRVYYEVQNSRKNPRVRRIFGRHAHRDPQHYKDRPIKC